MTAVEKNHEQYLEQIEIAVAETTKELMTKHNGDLRAMAKLVAEKQVEINRLKEFQNNDRKTIRDLRGNLKEASEEIDLYKEELDIAHHEYEKIKEEKYSLYLKWSEQKEEKRWADGLTARQIHEMFLSKEEILTELEKARKANLENFAGMSEEAKKNEELKKELVELKTLIENQKDYIDAIPDNIEEYKWELHAVMGENRMLKEEIDAVKEENKGLRNGGGDYISREEHQKVSDILNDEAEMYKVKFMELKKV